MPETADRTESLFAAAVALPPEERRRVSGTRMLRRRQPCATGYWLCSEPMIAPVT